MNVTLMTQEFQGLYGPFQVSELLIQKIWLRGAFDVSRMNDEIGRPVAVVSPGRWNRLSGPDFRGAILIIDGVRVEGDVEVHFTQRDWWSHGHHEDPSYGNVALHVVYEPPKEGDRKTLTAMGKEIPTVSLMDLLWYDLEEYASEDSIIESTRMDCDEVIEALLGRSLEARCEELRDSAAHRWRLKRHFAKRRIERCGWEVACHMTALEILGYAANRVPMLLVASSYSLSEMAKGALSAEALCQSGGGKWKTEGVRPANFPQVRLLQYLEWAKRVPHWPEALIAMGERLPDGSLDDQGSVAFRKERRCPAWRDRISKEVAGKQLEGSRLDTLICDGFLPLLAAATDRDLSKVWFHWYAGDAPARTIQNLKQMEVIRPRAAQLSNGWVQGLIGLSHRQSMSFDCV